MAALASPPDIPSVPVPKTNRNPVQSLRPAPITLLIKDREYTIPALPAADWLEILMRPSWGADDVLIELAGVEVETFLDMDIDETDNLMLDIIEEVSARHWWVTERLIQAMVAAWDVMGPETIFNGVDAERLSLAAWLDAVLILMLRRIKEDQAAMFAIQLEAPPAGEEIPEEEMEMSEGQFLSLGD